MSDHGSRVLIVSRNRVGTSLFREPAWPMVGLKQTVEQRVVVHADDSTYINRPVYKANAVVGDAAESVGQGFPDDEWLDRHVCPTRAASAKQRRSAANRPRFDRRASGELPQSVGACRGASSALQAPRTPAR